MLEWEPMASPRGDGPGPSLSSQARLDTHTHSLSPLGSAALRQASPELLNLSFTHGSSVTQAEAKHSHSMDLSCPASLAWGLVSWGDQSTAGPSWQQEQPSACHMVFLAALLSYCIIRPGSWVWNRWMLPYHLSGHYDYRPSDNDFQQEGQINFNIMLFI